MKTPLQVGPVVWAWLDAHDLWVGDHTAAEGGSERGGTGLTVPGHSALPRGAAH